ncbi:MAG: hypothetical protein ACLP5H_16225 [Desulfomonilaceae bacterium]
MLKQFVWVPALVVVISALGGAPVMGQSKEAGMKLYDDGQALYKNARSKEDLRQAVRKCEQALRIFETVKFDKGVGDTANILGVIYAKWGQYSRAVEYWEKSLRYLENSRT